MIQAKERFWDLIEELDSSIKFKDLAFSFLNPIALNRVANKHIKVNNIKLSSHLCMPQALC